MTADSHDPHLLYEKRDGVALLTMNRPDKRNALSPEMLVQLAEAWRDVRDDDGVRVAVLTGAGDAAFCAGADLGQLIPLLTRQRAPEDEWDERLLADRGAFSDGHKAVTLAQGLRDGLGPVEAGSAGATTVVGRLTRPSCGPHARPRRGATGGGRRSPWGR